MKNNIINDDCVIYGNPHFPTGRGSTAIGHFRAFKAILKPKPIFDIFSRDYDFPDPDIKKELREFIVRKPGKINIFHINADEVDRTLTHLGGLQKNSYNIIYPFWELSKYPGPWINILDQFDEIWAPSRFIEDSIKVGLPNKIISHMPLPVQLNINKLFGRRYFNLPEQSYIFLFFFDFRSYIDRKNPAAILDVFQKIEDVYPQADYRIVIKVHGSNIVGKPSDDYKQFIELINQSKLRKKVIMIDKVYTNNEINNLMYSIDCFISLHRSEGFGLGIAEAMYLGKPVICTGYSGNLDFTNDKVAHLIKYKLLPVLKDQYPYYEGQAWADPDVTHAANTVLQLLEDKQAGRDMGNRASLHIRTYFSYLAMGLRYQQRIDKVASEL